MITLKGGGGVYGTPFLHAWLLPDLNTIPDNCVREVILLVPVLTSICVCQDFGEALAVPRLELMSEVIGLDPLPHNAAF